MSAFPDKRRNDNTDIVHALNTLILSIDPTAETLQEKAFSDNTDVVKAIALLGLVVSDIGGGEIVTASNGLTKVGSDIRLGGVLIENTNIQTGVRQLTFSSVSGAKNSSTVFDSNGFYFYSENAPIVGDYLLIEEAKDSSFGFIQYVYDEFLNYEGLTNDLNGLKIESLIKEKWAVYGSDYSVNGSLNDRSIPDLGYVKSLIPTASNGLTKTEGVIQLGGALIKNTDINLNSFDFSLNQYSGDYLKNFSVISSGISMSTSLPDLSFSSSFESSFGQSSSIKVFNDLAQNEEIEVSNLGTKIKSQLAQKWLVYESDYSANSKTNDRSVPDLAYIKDTKVEQFYKKVYAPSVASSNFGNIVTQINFSTDSFYESKDRTVAGSGALDISGDNFVHRYRKPTILEITLSMKVDLTAFTCSVNVKNSSNEIVYQKRADVSTSRLSTNLKIPLKNVSDNLNTFKIGIASGTAFNVEEMEILYRSL